MIIETLLHNDTHSRLLLIFAGWGSDGKLYRNLTEQIPEGWDIIVVSGFDSDTLPQDIFSRYSTIYLFAWSLGVAAAEILLKNTPLTKAIAINGTPLPCNNAYGIPEAIYEGTCTNLNARNLTKFRRRMTRSAEEFGAIRDLLPQDSNITELQKQLNFIKESSNARLLHSADSTHSIKWNRAYISDSDAIIPSANQTKYWEEHTPSEMIIHVDGPHYIDLKKIANQIIHNPIAIGKRFHRALQTYDNAASPQRNISQTLINLLNRSDIKRGADVLEIGPGSGMLTRLWSKLIQAKSADFVDLYQCGPFEASAKDQYIISDAETWIGTAEKKYDYILSANTMQWFANPLEFIETGFRILKPGGTMLLSSFLPGNLKELDRLRPCPMSYTAKETLISKLKSMNLQLKDNDTKDNDTADASSEQAKACEGTTEIEESRIEIEFSGAREALLHLRHTGVGIPSESGTSGISLKRYEEVLKDRSGKCKLTYHPVFLRITKKG